MANRGARPAANADPLAALAADVANLTGIVGQLAQAVQATNNNVNNIANALPNPAGPVAFAMSPGTAAIDDVIDFKSKHGAQLYEAGSAALPTAISLKAQGILLFQRELQEKADKMGWTSPNQGVLTFTNAAGEQVNVITHPGKITHAEIIAGADRFINGAQANQRAAQNNHICSNCLTNSVAVDKRTQLLAYKSRYEVSPTAHPETTIIVAACFIKTLVELSTLDSTATNSALRNDLRNLNQICINSGGDVDKVIDYVTEKYTQLVSRGEDMPELVEIILEAFKDSIDDDNFSKYWDKKHSDYWDGEPTMAGVTVEQLLGWAKTKFDLLVSQKKWGAKSKEMEDIIALRAEVENLQGTNLKLSKQLAQKQKDKKAPANNGKVGDKPSKDAAAPKTKNKKNTSNKKKQKEEEAWMKVPPKDGEPTTKMYKGKKWYWCIHHMAWTMHTPEDCKLGKERAAAAADKSVPTSTMANKATVSADDYNAYAALMGTLAASAAASFQE